MQRTGFAALTATALALVTAAPAWAERSDVRADLDGDGRVDPVSLVQVSDSAMLLRAGMAGEFVDVEVPGNAGGLEPEPVNVNGDGVDEVLVPESVGANTTTRTAWAYSAEQGLHPLREVDGELWRLPEGGGAAAVSTFGCDTGRTGRAVEVVSAARDEQGTFDGRWLTYRVVAGSAHLVRDVAVRDADREDVASGADPAECVPGQAG